MLRGQEGGGAAPEQVDGQSALVSNADEPDLEMQPGDENVIDKLHGRINGRPSACFLVGKVRRQQEDAPQVDGVVGAAST